MTTPAKDMFELFSQALFEGVKPMMVLRDHLVRHPDRCTHNAVCIPVFAMRRNLPPVSRRLPVAGDLCGVSEG